MLLSRSWAGGRLFLESYEGLCAQQLNGLCVTPCCSVAFRRSSWHETFPYNRSDVG